MGRRKRARSNLPLISSFPTERKEKNAVAWNEFLRKQQDNTCRWVSLRSQTNHKEQSGGNDKHFEVIAQYPEDLNTLRVCSMETEGPDRRCWLLLMHSWYLFSVRVWNRDKRAGLRGKHHGIWGCEWDQVSSRLGQSTLTEESRAGLKPIDSGPAGHSWWRWPFHGSSTGRV